jgi:L-fuconolactonase
VIIDAHQHFWDPARADYSFLESVPSLRRCFGPEDLQPELESNQIDASIAVQALAVGYAESLDLVTSAVATEM